MIGLSNIKPVKKIDPSSEMPLFSNENDGEYVQFAELISQAEMDDEWFHAPFLHKHHEPTPQSDAFIEFINKGNFTWKADTCLLSKGHPMYKCDEEKPKLVQ